MRFEHEVVYFPSQMLVVGQLVVAVAFGSVLGRDQVPDQIYEVAVFDNVDLSVLALLALQPDLDERLFALDPLVEADLEDVLFYELSQRLLPLGVHETASGRCLHVIWFVQRFEHLGSPSHTTSELHRRGTRPGRHRCRFGDAHSFLPPGY